MELVRTAFQAGTARRNAIPFDRFLHCVSATTACLRKSKIIVRRNVESACFRARVYLSVVAILGVSVINKDSASSNARDRMGEAIIHATLEPTGVERIKI